MDPPIDIGSPPSELSSRVPRKTRKNEKSSRRIKHARAMALGPGLDPCLVPPIDEEIRAPVSVTKRVLAAPNAVSARKVTHLVFGGGGVRGWAHVGLIKFLSDTRDPLLSKAEVVVGTSIGAAIALACAIGVDSERVEKLFRDTCKALTTSGGSKADLVEEVLRTELKYQTKKSRMTFAELSKRPDCKRLKTTFTDAITQRLGVCSVETTPNEDIITSTVDSMRIPIVFGHRADPVTWTCRMDGGFVDNMPMRLCPPETSIGFYLIGKTTLGADEKPRYIRPESIKMVDAVMITAGMLLSQIPESEVPEAYKKSVIAMDAGFVSTLNFAVSDSQIDELMKIGRTTAEILVAMRSISR